MLEATTETTEAMTTTATNQTAPKAPLAYEVHQQEGASPIKRWTRDVHVLLQRRAEALHKDDGAARRVRGSAGSPRCSRMRLTTSSFSIQATTFIGPVQRGQTKTSVAYTRLSNEAQSRRSVDRGVVDFGVSGVSGVVDVDGGWGTTSARRRLVGAKTPGCASIHHLAVMNRVRFAYVGGPPQPPMQTLSPSPRSLHEPAQSIPEEHGAPAGARLPMQRRLPSPHCLQKKAEPQSLPDEQNAPAAP